MKNLLKYHLVTGLPMLLLLYLYIFKIMDFRFFFFLFLIYAFVLRPLIDFQRLKEKGLMTDKDFWKIFGLVRFRYYYQLMFEK